MSEKDNQELEDMTIVGYTALYRTDRRYMVQQSTAPDASCYA